MDKYEQFQIEQSILLKALAESGPSESLMRRMQALYKDACLVVALGPSMAIQRSPDDEGRESADEKDVAYYVKAIESGALVKIFEVRAWGDVSLEYEALVLEEQFSPGIRVSWSNKIAFLAEGKDGTFNTKLEGMAGALARMLSAQWYRCQVRLV
jgi:hypothetical protein